MNANPVSAVSPGGGAGPIDRRDGADRRFKTFWPISLRTAAGTRRVHVLNISVSGAKLHAQQRLNPGETVEILLAGRWWGGIVKWSGGSNCGILFDENVSPETLQSWLDSVR
jgi:hypothetical protein